MEGLQRSAVSFRRTGSSGHVWDDKFLGELLVQANNQARQEQQQKQQQEGEVTTGSSSSSGNVEIKQENAPLNLANIEVKPPRGVSTMERSRSNGGGQRGYRTGKVSPAVEPPSPKVSACGFCSAFGSKSDKGRRRKAGKVRSR